ncbi:MAG: HpcH/HpaI aldolase family protein [Acidimicrobiales bacterium]
MPSVRLAVHSTTADPDVVEMCAAAGAHVYIVDLEHGPAGMAECAQAIRAAQAVGIEAHFRVPLPSLAMASRLVDAGAEGIHVADVRGPADSARAAQAIFHPPAGARGYGGCRRNGYGLARPDDGKGATQLHDDEPLFGVQLESREGLQNLDSILQSALFGLVSVGTRDLAADLGHAGVMDHSAVEAALEQVAREALARGIAFAEMTRSPRQLSQAVARGASWVLVPLAAVLREGLTDFLVGSEG